MPATMRKNIQIVIPSHRAGTISWLCQQIKDLGYGFQITDIKGYWASEKEPCKCVSLYYEAAHTRAVFRVFAAAVVRLLALGEQSVMTVEDGAAHFYQPDDHAALETIVNA